MPDFDAEAVVEHAAMIGLISAEEMFQAKLDATDGSAEAVLRALLRKDSLTSWQVERLQKGELNIFFYGGCKALFHLAEGTFARVYRGKRMTDGMAVAIKVLRHRFVADKDAVAAFDKEAEAGMSLRHPNIVEILDHGEQDKKHYMIMEYVEGSNLRDLLKIRIFLDAKSALPLMIDLCRGLKYSFEHGVTHRDLKASNVLVASNGTAKLVDFGLANIQGDEKKAGAVNPRTIDYSTLERTCGSEKGDPRSDIFFLGCIFYQMLTGQPAMPETETKDMLQKMLKRGINSIKPLAENPRAPDAELTRIIETMMKVDLKARYKTIDAVLDDLLAYQRGESPHTSAVDDPESEHFSIEELLFGPHPSAAGPGSSILAQSPFNYPLEMEIKPQDGPRRTPTILCVEASADVQDAFRKQLSKMGYRVLLVGDAERAVERFREEMPDAVLFDIDGLGSTSLKHFLEMHAHARDDGRAFVAVVLLGTRHRALREKLPADDQILVLDKPIKMKHVQAALDDLLPIG